jgi:hypothetical protein
LHNAKLHNASSENTLAKQFEHGELDYQKFGVNQVEYTITESNSNNDSKKITM